MRKINRLALCLLNGIFIASTVAMEERRNNEEFDLLFSSIRGIEGSIPQKGENAVLFLGYTGAGKSSLLTYLANPEFVYAEEDDWGEYRIKAHTDIPLRNIHIAQGLSVSGTLLPANYGEYWDLPGFEDTRGPTQEIINSFSIYKLAQVFRSVKLLLVAPESSIRGDRAIKFLQSVETVRKIFESNNINQLTQSLCLIVTKSQNTDNSRIKRVLNQIAMEQSTQNNFTASSRKIIESLASASGQVVVFRAPQQSGNIPDDDRNSILEAINHISYLENFNPIIPPSSGIEIHINRLITQFVREFSELISNNFVRSIVDYCESSIKNHSGIAQDLRKSLGNFLDSSALRSISRDTENFNNNFTIFSDATRLLGDKNLENNFRSQRERYEFINLVNPKSLAASWYNNEWYRDIMQLIRDIESLKALSKEKEGTFLTLKGLIVGIEDINRAIKEGISEISVYSLNSLFIDADIEAFGANLALLSPRWKVVGERKITLKGEDGLNYKVSKAKNGCESEPGENGLPGLPGYSGGHFYGKGKDFFNLSSLTIDLSGGKGGTGQDGGNGGKGCDGEDGNLQDVVGRKELALKSKKQLKLDRLEEINSLFEETYETGTLGGKGKNGGQGGIGGYGGNTGHLIIEPISQQDVLKKIFKVGQKGPDGYAGDSGSGGKNGKRYRGVYLNQVLEFNQVKEGLNQIKEKCNQITQDEVTATVTENSQKISQAATLALVSYGAPVVLAGLAAGLGVGVATATAGTTEVGVAAEAVATLGEKAVATLGEVGAGKVLVAGTGGVLAGAGAIAGGVLAIPSTLLGVGMAAAIGGISAHCSSDWKEQPIEIDDTDYASDGGYALQILHENQGLDMLDNLEAETLAVYLKGEQIYCKIKGEEEIRINVSDIDSEVFRRIKKVIQARDDVENRDKKALLKFASDRCYTTSLNEDGLKSPALRVSIDLDEKQRSYQNYYKNVGENQFVESLVITDHP